MTLDILTISGAPKDKIELPDAVFGQKPRKDLLWDAMTSYLANQRQGAACTKTRAEVSGGGKKPWRQKHTGRARHGSTRSPIWRHGGIVFGPRPRDFEMRLPAGKRVKALHAALSTMQRENRIRVVEDFELSEAKTRELAKIVKDLGLHEDTVLLLIAGSNPKLQQAARNLANLDLMRVSDLNAYQAVAHRTLVFTRSAIEHYSQSAQERKSARAQAEEK
jgi:large subunit ribosomal protein L4